MVMERSRWIQDRFLEVMEDCIIVWQTFTFPPATGRRYFLTPLMVGLTGGRALVNGIWAELTIWSEKRLYEDLYVSPRLLCSLDLL